MIVWLVGMSGAGKTTIGRKVADALRARAPNTVFIDGDEIRAVFAQDRDPDAHALSGRRKNAERIVELCAWLDAQQIHVVCCILCIFPDVLEKNRTRFAEYREVYVRAGMDTLRKRDTKGLYARADAGLERNVVGVDLPFPPPAHPDLILDTDGELSSDDCAARVLELCEPGDAYPFASGDRLEQRNTYFYTRYLGRPFFRAWQRSRQAAAGSAEPSSQPGPAAASEAPGPRGEEPDGTGAQLARLYRAFSGSEPVPPAAAAELDELLQRFEVTKRIYAAYGPHWKAVKGASYRELGLYLDWAELLERAFERSHALPYLNALLKTLDTLSSQQRLLSAPERARLARLVARERVLVEQLAQRCGVQL